MSLTFNTCPYCQEQYGYHEHHYCAVCTSCGVDVGHDPTCPIPMREGAKPIPSGPTPVVTPEGRLLWEGVPPEAAISREVLDDEYRRAVRVLTAAMQPDPDDDPCPHDCADGVGTITERPGPYTVTVRTIWECTVCRAIGEDTTDGGIVWADAE